jgi:hypothetical protein
MQQSSLAFAAIGTQKIVKASQTLLNSKQQPTLR